MHPISKLNTIISEKVLQNEVNHIYDTIRYAYISLVFINAHIHDPSLEEDIEGLE